MNSERWQRVALLFQSVLEREPAEREAFLAEACCDDVDLRREIESLPAQEGAPVLIERPAEHGGYGAYILGGMMTVAFLAVVMPTTTMASIADWLGVGPLHRSPLTEYLTRSLSALYGTYGVLHLYLARDVVRYLDLIVVLGWLAVLAGAILTVVDFAAGMPAYWSWSEGPPTAFVGFVLIWLARRAR